MSSQEVNRLRKEGNLRSAFELAKQNMINDPQNIWNKRAIAWVYYDYAKEYSHKGVKDKFLSILSNIALLQLDENDNMLFDNLCWSIFTFVNNLSPKDENLSSFLYSLFKIIKCYSFKPKSLEFTILFKTFYKHRDSWKGYIDFCEWWGFDNFRDEDYLREKLPNGKEVPCSIAESAYLSYSKAILKRCEMSKISVFLPKLDVLIESHPEMIYTGYYKGKLLIAIGDKENLLNTLLPFVTKKKNEFWSWLLLSEALTEDRIKCMACLYKATSCITQEKFLTNVRLKLANQLIKDSSFNEAKFQIEKIIAARLSEGFGLSEQILLWMNSNWYHIATSTAVPKVANFNNITQSLLLSNIKETIIVIDYVNNEKKMAGFVYGLEKKGFFNYSKLKADIRVGDVLKVRFENTPTENGFVNIITLNQCDEQPDSSFFQVLQGRFIYKLEDRSGKVNGKFIPQSFVAKEQLNTNDEVKVFVTYSYNHNRNCWSWKCCKAYKVF